MAIGIEIQSSTADLDDRAQIAEFVRRFYADVAEDDLLGPIFNDVAEVDWDKHIPKLTAFWCRALLSEPGYQGNPFQAHQRIHLLRPFTTAHFNRWLELFRRTLVDGWNGPFAERAWDLAQKVADVHARHLGVEAGHE